MMFKFDFMKGMTVEEIHSLYLSNPQFEKAVNTAKAIIKFYVGYKILEAITEVYNENV